MLRLLASVCGGAKSRGGVTPAGEPPPAVASPDPHSAAAEAYVTTNGAGKDDGTVAVSVASTTDETSSVKLVRMRLLDPAASFTFRPGQWVDFWAPGIPKPGGYSVASSPGQIRRDGTFDLLVKTSRSSACGQWIYGRCAPGDEARVRVGGSFFASEADLRAPLLLLAGGIGISPLYALLRTLVEERLAPDADDADDAEAPRALRAILLCSGKNLAEQPMVSRVRSLVAESRGAVRCVFHVTGHADASVGVSAEDSRPTPGVVARRGRVDAAALERAMDELRSSGGGEGEVISFLCGPPAMSDAMEGALVSLGLPPENVRLERWW